MKNRNTMKPLYVPFLILITIAFLGSCKKDEVKPSVPVPVVNANDVSVNTWIDSNMRYWYLWADQIPANPDKTKKPDAFFESLLYTTLDRFSWIQENYTDLLNELNGISKQAGYDFIFYRDSPSNDKVTAQIILVKPNSPASRANLERGDVIYQINNTPITTTNYIDLYNQLSKNHSISYFPIDFENQTVLSPLTISLEVVEYTEDPNYLSKILNINDHKIGYYVYNFFAEGDAKKYDNEMDAQFSQFKNAGITDLILDLRYNSGGSGSSAINLASLIAPVTSSDVFYKDSFNPVVQADIIADPNYGEAFLLNHFLEKSQNISSQLTGNRVYILTGPYTASASELVINGLKPFMEVFLIGKTTYGKNVGSISIYDDTNPNNKWGLQPIVLKVANSLDQSDYANGFAPDVDKNEYEPIPYPLGNANEILLHEAVERIIDTAFVSRKEAVVQLEAIGNSLSSKPHSFTLTMGKDKNKKLNALMKNNRLLNFKSN